MGGRPKLVAALGLAGAVTVLVFTLSTALVEHHAAPITDAARDVREDVLPRLYAMIELRRSVHSLEAVALRAALDSDPSETMREIDRVHGEIEAAWTLRARSDTRDGTVASPFMLDARARVDALERSVREVVAMVAAGHSSDARRVVDTTASPAARAAHDALTALAVDCVTTGDAKMRALLERRTETRQLALALDLAAAAVAAVLTVLVMLLLRRHMALERAHKQLLEQRARELDAFSARVAHDVMSPLMAIHMSVAMVRSLIDGPPRALSAVSRCESGVAQVKLLVTDLLDFARAEANADRAARTPLREVVDEVVSSTTAVEPEVDIEVGAVPDCEVTCARGVLLSIMGNLIGNAAKFTRGRPKRRIWITASATTSRLRCTIEDSGPGIAADDRSRVFQPYVRCGATGAPGLGLGLATVKRLVEAHGGRVGVASEVGVGSTFWFELPCESRHHAADVCSSTMSSRACARRLLSRSHV